MKATTRTRHVGAGRSTAAAAGEAGREAAREAATGLQTSEVDLAFLFLSPAHLEDAEAAAEAVRQELAPQHLVGCVAEGILAGRRELEEGPAAAVWAASLPGATIECFHAVVLETDEGVVVAGFPGLDEPSLVTLLVDPFTFPAAPFLARLNVDRPGVPLVGGIAAGGGAAGAQALILDGEIHSGGAVGAAVSGIEVRTLVSQGCAPVGRDLVITSAEGNLVYELAGEPALEQLRSELAGASPEQQRLAMGGILAGLVIDENRPEYGRGDYLMRGVLGADDSTGALALGERVRVGQTVRFHVRDAASADEDLRETLASLGGMRPAGALLFTCNGRGTNMFAEPDHDAALVSDVLGTEALAGFFCGGEIGPVGGRAFLHGFTATLAVFLES
jgi:small ligand-binding sensory domain FIST